MTRNRATPDLDAAMLLKVESGDPVAVDTPYVYCMVICIAFLVYGGLVLFQKMFTTTDENDRYIKDLESNRDGSVLMLIDL